jgi:hypothetical protein
VKILSYGDIMQGGISVFESVATLDGRRLKFSFAGVIRIDNPYKHLEPQLKELENVLSPAAIDEVEIDFTKLRFCNSNGFYVIMDICEALYGHTKGPVTVRRLHGDDWQQETLPILLDLDSVEIAERTTFDDVPD